jgi:hypothetical protein
MDRGHALKLFERIEVVVKHSDHDTPRDHNQRGDEANHRPFPEAPFGGIDIVVVHG